MSRDRVNIYLSSDLKGWYQDRAKEMGLSMSQLMQFALSTYMEQQNVLKSMPSMLNQMKELIILKEQAKGKQDEESENGEKGAP